MIGIVLIILALLIFGILAARPWRRRWIAPRSMSMAEFDARHPHAAHIRKGEQ